LAYVKVVIDGLHHTEIAQLDLAILSDKQVLKLDVKVGHASFLVQGFQALAHLEEDELE